MDIFSLLSYINKVSLLAFFVTIVVVGYQIYVLKKEKINEKAPAIPDFDAGIKSNEVANYTNLPGSLTKKENKQVNYSRLIFLTIFLLTAVVIGFILIIIRRNSSVVTQTAPAVVPTTVIPKKTVPSPTLIAQSDLVSSSSPTIVPLPSPLLTSTPVITERINPSPTEVSTPTPTEIILAKAPSLTPAGEATVSKEAIQTLPETGSIQKGLLIIGVAILTIVFSFWF